MRKPRETKDLFRWRIRNAYAIALGIMLIGGAFAFIWGTSYFFGEQEHIHQGREGTWHVPAREPGSPADRLGAQVGLVLVGVGALVAAVTGIIHLIFRPCRDAEPPVVISRPGLKKRL